MTIHATPRELAAAAADGSFYDFAVAESSLGLVLVARSGRGVCAVLIGDEREALRRDLEARFPGVPLREGGGELRALARRVSAFIESPARASLEDVVLAPRGTPFQRAVWQALREVPAGSTTTYNELARRVGRPAAVRAVAGACAANPLAVVVPCHRAVRSDGGLSGYRWGVPRKRALLELEAGA